MGVARKHIGAIVVATMTGLAGLVVTASPASAAVVCGQSITTSTTLTSDLNCPGPGLFVNASNVVLDLGGRTITGTQADGTFFAGVTVGAQSTGVIVRNGTIRGFSNGVLIRPGVTGTIVTGLTLDGNALGVITQADVPNSMYATNSRIFRNTIVNTTRFSGIQLGGNGHRVELNTFANSASTAIFLFGDDNVISSNTITDSGGNGVSISTSPSDAGPFERNQIVNNTITGSARVFTSASISVRFAAATTVIGNTVSGRLTTPGVFVENSSGTQVSGNRLDTNNEGVLVRGNSVGTDVRQNRSQQNRQGIVVSNPASGTVLTQNIANNNQFDGINVGAPGTTLKDNVAYGNGGLGIRAVSGVIDGGGNTAFANGNPAQCSPTISC